MTLQSLILCPPDDVTYYKNLLVKTLRAITVKTSNIENGCIILSEHPVDNIMRNISDVQSKSSIPLNNITWLVRNLNTPTKDMGLWYFIHNSRKEYPFLDAIIKVKEPTVRDDYTIVSKDKFFN